MWYTIGYTFGYMLRYTLPQGMIETMEGCGRPREGGLEVEWIGKENEVDWIGVEEKKGDW